MAETSLFVALSSRRIAELIGQATRHVCYAAPGIQDEPAAALIALAARTPTIGITINLDFHERTLRMGYGSLPAVEKLREAKIETSHFSGFRSSILLVDDCGWVFTPTALYLEPEPHSDETPNALRLSPSQVQELLIRLSPTAREEAIAEAATPEEAREIAAIPLELSTHPVEVDQFEAVKEAITLAPPVKFDIARQVRVFEPYLQYVELSLSGAAIQRHRVRIPKSIQSLGSSADLEGRLQTTFDLIEKDDQFSSKKLDGELNEIRKNFTPSLGKDHGRVVLKSAKPVLIQRIEALRQKLQDHQAKVEAELQKRLDQSREQVVEYYMPRACQNPPDKLIGQSLLGKPTDDDIRDWLINELDKAFPKASALVGKMILDERYKDVTFETLNRPDFLESVKEAYPIVNWEKAYEEFRAAGEKSKATEPGR